LTIVVGENNAGKSTIAEAFAAVAGRLNAVRHFSEGKRNKAAGNRVSITLTSPDELMTALKRYLEQCGKTEQAVASQIGVNRHTLARWLSDKESPKKGKLALTAFFLRRAGYLTASKNIQSAARATDPPSPLFESAPSTDG